MIVVGNGAELRRTPEAHSVTAIESARGGFRVEVRVPRAPGLPPVPWLVSNPIYFLPPPAEPVAAPVEGEVIPLPAGMAWHVEKDLGSRATLTASAGQVTLDYTLRTGDRASQFAALVADLQMRAPQFSRIRLTASAARPGRLSIQLRYPQSGGRAVGNIRLCRFNAARGRRRDRRHAAGRSAVRTCSGSLLGGGTAVRRRSDERPPGRFEFDSREQRPSRAVSRVAALVLLPASRRNLL